MSGDNPWVMVNLEKIIQIAFRGMHIRAIRSSATRPDLVEPGDGAAKKNGLALIRAIRCAIPDWECSIVIGAFSSASAECREDPTYLVAITEHGAELPGKREKR